MKPPTSEAVERALAILIKSINEQNGTAFASQPSKQRFDHPVAELDKNNLALHIAHESVEKRAKTWAASLRKSRNSFIPIGTLPVELTAEILLASLRVKDRTNMKHLQGLSHVCSRWWDIILSFPRFWTTINSSKALGLKLRRSGSMPLIIVMHYMEKEHALRMLNELAHHIRRWGYLQTSGGSTGLITDLLVESSAPQLKQIDLKGSPVTVMRLSPTHCPSLRFVHFVNIIVTSWNALRGLTKISITNIPRLMHDPPPAKLLEILASCPRLESLDLHNFGIKGDALTAKLPINLPRLRRLTLLQVESKLSRAIICGVCAEGLLDFQLMERGLVGVGV